MNNDDTLYSSIYHVLGLAYDWNVAQMATLYKVTPAQFNLWLYLIGVPDDIIKIIKNREGYKQGYCKHCGFKIKQGIYCNPKCDLKRSGRDEIIASYLETGIIGTTNSKYKYNVNTGETVSD